MRSLARVLARYDDLSIMRFFLRSLWTSLMLGLPLLGTDFRPPSVPLIVHDPYFSVWSNADQLTAEPTKHWTGTVQSVDSLVRIDGKTFRLMGTDPRHTPALTQQSLKVLPTHTIYTFAGSGVSVTLTFLNPALPQNLELVARPVTYITWTVQSTDKAKHDVQIYFDAASQLAVNTPGQPVEWGRFRAGDLQILRVGTQQQPILEKSGDDLRIDWGYLYLAAPHVSGTSDAATTRDVAIGQFTNSGEVPNHDDLRAYRRYNQGQPVLATSFTFGSVGEAAASRHLALAYDDIDSIEYLNRRLKGYWTAKSRDAGELLQTALDEYPTLDQRSTDFDRELMADLTHVGGEHYAELCALAYSQTIAAHKLTAGLRGEPLYFSKENFSNGSIDTVDVSYPSAPFFLLFNTRLLEGQLRPILDYASLPRWKFPFSPHDLGRYPLANGQQYGGGENTEDNQMPVEESGNMLLMIAGIAQVNHDPALAREYWPVLTKWAEYLRAKGLDPENQLSTDDFAGHLAHNANLSIKAILALAAYGKLATAVGQPKIGKQYTDAAREYAARWVGMDKEGDHYRLAFDQPNTWSQKYNLVWDRLLHLDIFARTIIEQELRFYDAKVNQYGLPLDNRADYTKIDWLTWTASLAPTRDGFSKIFDPAFRFADATSSRVPLTDWYDTKTGKQVGFQARSVVGGLFIQMLTDQAIWTKYSERALATDQ